MHHIFRIFMWSITVTLAFVYAVIFQWTLNPPTVRIAKVTMTSSTPATEVIENTTKKEKVWALQWKDEDGGKTIIATSTDESIWSRSNGVYRTIFNYKRGDKNFVIFPNTGEKISVLGRELTSTKDEYYEIIQYNDTINLFDVNSKEVRTIFELRDLPFDYHNAEKIVFEIYSLNLIEDTLYFTIGGRNDDPHFGTPTIEGGTFYIDLSSEEMEVKSLKTETIDTFVYVVKKMWGKYWLYRNGAYILFDPETKELGEKIEVSSYAPGEWSDGNVIIGVIKDNVVILGNQGFLPETASLNTYYEVTMHQLNDENSKITIFNTSTIPKGVQRISLLEEENILLEGEELTIYNLNTGTTKKISEADMKNIKLVRSYDIIEPILQLEVVEIQ